MALAIQPQQTRVYDGLWFEPSTRFSILIQRASVPASPPPRRMIQPRCGLISHDASSGRGSGGLALGEARGNPVGPPPTAVRDREWTSLARARRARGFFSLVPSREGKTSAPTEGTRLSPRFTQPQLATQITITKTITNQNTGRYLGLEGAKRRGGGWEGRKADSAGNGAGESTINFDFPLRVSAGRR